MLKLITGRAGAGKTAYINSLIKKAVDEKQENIILIVPEQYSHEAERELCRVCGDRLSLYAEVLSFTGLARKLRAETGGAAEPFLDAGGRLLCMALALKKNDLGLDIFRNARSSPDMQNILLGTIEEMKNSGVTPEQLRLAADKSSADSTRDGLNRKLRELSVIASEYDAKVKAGYADPSDSLTALAETLENSGTVCKYDIYIDGFTDFTGAQHILLKALMEKGASLTVALTTESPVIKNGEIFALSKACAARLAADAKACGAETAYETVEPGTPELPLRAFADNVFTYSDTAKGAGADAQLFVLDNPAAECEFAAARALELVREKGCRWRDIAIAIRSFDDYCPMLESVFSQYGVPLLTARRTALDAKPLPTFIRLMYDVTSRGWQSDDVISCLGTGLTGLDSREADMLSAYVFRWHPGEASWRKPELWHQHPDGYGQKADEESNGRLAEINRLRERFAAPAGAFEDRNAKAETAGQFTVSLMELLEEMKIPEQLSARAEELRKAGIEEEADEYCQVWKVFTAAAEQFYAIAGDMKTDAQEYSKLLQLMLSKYDIGVIPSAVDRVTAGDFDRMRRRTIKHLIILGAEDSRLPAPEGEKKLFSSEELEMLREDDILLGGDPSNEIWREFLLIYNCLYLPSQSLTVTYPAAGSGGEQMQPSVVFERAEKYFGIEEPKHCSLSEARTAAPGPALILAVSGTGAEAAAAAKYFEKHSPERLGSVRKTGRHERGSLSEKSAEALYGDRVYISATKADTYFSCKYSFFCSYGLKAKALERAVFQPSDVGTFMHDVLEKTLKQINEKGGFRSVTDEEISRLTDMNIARYIKEELGGLDEKPERFKYLIGRLEKDVHEVVSNTAEELRASDFVPLAFELDFGKSGITSSLPLGRGKDALRISGIADRVDGWTNGGRTYVRIADYKTGKKEFSLSDIWYGKSMQMPLYLYALKTSEKAAEALKLKEGSEIVPAGVMYVPARDEYVSFTARPEPQEAAEERRSSLKRSGIVLDAPGVREAWERGDNPVFTPVKIKKGGIPDTGTLAGEEKINLLFSHVKLKLEEMAAGIHAGHIETDPHCQGEKQACTYCRYNAICGFTDGEGEDRFVETAKLTSEDAWGRMEEEVRNSGSV